MGISYRKAWGDLKSAEENLGYSLIEKHRGGKQGGKTILTPLGEKLIKAYADFHSRIETFIMDAFDDFASSMNKVMS